MIQPGKPVSKISMGEKEDMADPASDGAMARQLLKISEMVDPGAKPECLEFLRLDSGCCAVDGDDNSRLRGT